MAQSRINPMLTLEYMQNEHENKYFDRKSAKIKPSDLAPLISAFANADGGTIVIGISDKTHKLEGINLAGEDHVNEFIAAPNDCCKPMPQYTDEMIDIENSEGKADRLLLLHIQKSVDHIREFTMLDVQSGKFHIVPEYPEFAWLEGIVNAVTHREYAMSGVFIKVSMYDDRLEIESPGRLPNIVTLENIKETRYSRNPRISRVMTEFGWVRELNEGVKRIYDDMAGLFLDDPVYSEPGESLRLVLKNNIVMRKMRQDLYAVNNLGISTWNQLDATEQAIMAYILNRGAASRAQLSEYTGKSYGTVRTRLKHLIDIGLVAAKEAKYAPNQTYEAIIPDSSVSSRPSL